MIDAKDTFYIMLRDRLASLNPLRTMGLRGVTRPGVLVEENELVTQDVLPDVFRLRWTALHLNTDGPLPLVTMTCEIRYSTAGSAANGGMDRGRMLTQMHSELSAALRTAPQFVPKNNYTNSGFGGRPVTMATNIFWNDATFSTESTQSEQVETVATVQVFCYQEVGE